MKRYVIRVGWMLLLLGVCSYTLKAQSSDKNYYNFDFIKNSNGWLTSNNASGLCNIPVQNTSIFEAAFNKGNGGFVNYHQSGNSYDIGAMTESFSRLGENVFLYGKLSYDYFRGQEMGGSVFIDPYFSSFNIVEMSDTTYGRKTKEMYHLVGGVGVDVAKGFRIGGKIDYTSGNYSKARDIRHSNGLLNMTVTAGLSYQLGNVVNIGLNYLYKRYVESLYFNIYGTTDKFYDYLIDFGAFYGKREQSAEQGYTDLASNIPSVSKFQGGSLQLDFKISPEVHFFNEFTYKSRNGYYGKRSQSTIVYLEDNGMELDYSGHLSFSNTTSQHIVKIAASYRQLSNNENIYRINYQDGKQTISYFGNNEVCDRATIVGNLEYTANLGIRSYCPEIVLKAGADAFYRDLTTSIYPFYRKQDILSVIGYLSGNYNIIKDKQIYGFRLGGGYGFGTGTMFNDGTYAPVTTQKVPKTMETALQREFEFLTAGRINANAGFRYSHFFKKGITGYVDVDYKFIDGLNIVYLKGNMHHSVTFTTGISF
ncbi:MAG: hypothetical protein PHD11_03055 [Bacteroidales bacterium]|nr:hypothetical protein [Bacteroidales bacterium]MDD4669425.1 hypothetical protein [Bacteroidales bacterium]